MDAVLEEVENAIDDCEGEVQRLQEVERRLLMENACGPECAGCHEEGAVCKPAFRLSPLKPLHRSSLFAAEVAKADE